MNGGEGVMKQIENKCMLITYGNSMGSNLKEMEEILDTHFREELGGVHILPFFPSSGDRGFAVINYDIVDPEMGTWEDIDRLSEKYFLAADFMLNHVSIRSEEFRDYMEKGDASEYRNMFIHWEEFWPQGAPTEEDLKVLYSRKPNGPCKTFIRRDGTEVHLWNTFFEEQVDIDPHDPATQAYYDRNLKQIASHVPMIRFDAFAYASKVPGTTCFFVEPEVWDVLDISTRPLRETGTKMLAEIHEEYHIQLKLAEKGHYVYDFALPLILLHGLEFGRTDRLINWLRICPHNQITTLDTHDGIGVVDAAGLLTEEEMDEISTIVRDRYLAHFMELPEEVRAKDIFWNSKIRKGNQKEKIYQLGGTFFSAMDENEDAYLLARIVQFYTPGIPQVYYVGLLAGLNDFDALRKGLGGREVNRHNFTREEIVERMQMPMLQKMYEIMRFRNTYDAFNGDFTVDESDGDGLLHITWQKDELKTELYADFTQKTWKITYTDPATGEVCEIVK